MLSPQYFALPSFAEWLKGLKNPTDRRRILSRLRRIEQGNLGDHKFIRDGVYEMRLFFGPGYRLYFARDGENIIILLCGGDKDSQHHDITHAITLWQEYQGNDQITNH